MFGPLPHITLIIQLFKILDNILNILHTDIINGISYLFVFLWTYIGLETQRGNQPLSWSSLIIFWIWRCDFHLVQNTKFQRDFQSGELITILNLYVFTSIATNTISLVHGFELTYCEFFLPERLLSGANMINRHWCYNC